MYKKSVFMYNVQDKPRGLQESFATPKNTLILLLVINHLMCGSSILRWRV